MIVDTVTWRAGRTAAAGDEPDDHPFFLSGIEPDRYTGEIHGNYFATFVDRSAQTSGVLVTRDSGASWQRTNLVSEFLGVPVVLGFDGWQYLALDRGLEASPDGITWHPIPMPAFIPVKWQTPVPLADRPVALEPAPGQPWSPSIPTTMPPDHLFPAYYVSMAMSPAGLLLSDETTVYRLVSGTGRFVPIPFAPSTGQLWNSGGRVLAVQADGGRIRQVTTFDGLFWEPVGPPAS